jgi:hypothetical protein
MDAMFVWYYLTLKEEGLALKILKNRRHSWKGLQLGITGLW